MKVSNAEVLTLIDEVLAACPALAATTRAKVSELIGIIITMTNETNGEVERRISEAGTIPPDITMTLMHYGALLGVVKDLPAGNNRRTLIEAGEKIGAFIARKYGEKIQETLVDKARKH